MFNSLIVFTRIKVTAHSQDQPLCCREHGHGVHRKGCHVFQEDVAINVVAPLQLQLIPLPPLRTLVQQEQAPLEVSSISFHVERWWRWRRCKDEEILAKYSVVSTNRWMPLFFEMNISFALSKGGKSEPKPDVE